MSEYQNHEGENEMNYLFRVFKVYYELLSYYV
jgi:hypothetical protein